MKRAGRGQTIVIWVCVCVWGGGGKVGEVAECLVTWGGGGGFNLNQQMIFVYVFTLPKHYHSVP